MNLMNFNEWLESLPGAPTPSVAAKHAGLPKSGLLRHADRGYTTAENVISISRAYGVSPIDSLIAQGFLRPEEAVDHRADVLDGVKRAKWSELFSEISARVNASGFFDGEFTLNLDDALDGDLPNELDDEGNAVMPLTAVAYNGPDEDAQRGDGE